MNDNDIIKAFDVLDKFEFFGGQRAGRLLWFNKPADIQEKDIGGFNRDIDFLKAFINRQRAEIERLNAEIEELKRVATMRIEEEDLSWERREALGCDDKEWQEEEAFSRLMEIAEMTEEQE
ncbi:MAG: hypothetical protein IJF28_05050 [Firmicutes bacterium]|nr:hypothetical protein [Bacillota bacterium]